MYVQEDEIKHDTKIRIIPTLKDHELLRISDMQEVLNSVIHPLYRSLALKIPEYEKISYTRKGEGTNMQYGYYISYFLKEVVELINYFEIKSLLDLGCGAGLFTSMLRIATGIKVGGFDNEKVLINNKLSYVKHENFELKDITNIDKSDISEYDCVYFWEPIINRETCEKFIDNLVRQMPDNQYIIYKCDGPARDFLTKQKNLTLLAVHGGDVGPLRVYQRKPRKGK